MEKKDILSQIQDIFRDVLANDEIVLTEMTTAMDIDGWTSLAQTQILAAIEHEMNLRFSLMEIMEMKNVEQIIEVVASKTNN